MPSKGNNDIILTMKTKKKSLDYIKEKYIFTKKDGWTRGNHPFSSASVDLMDHFYLAIHETFITQFADPSIFIQAKAIQKQYQTQTMINAYFFKLSKTREKPLNTKDFKKIVDLNLEQIDYSTPLDTQIYPNTKQKIYNSFDDFYYLADHGFDKNEEKTYCFVKQLWEIYIQKFHLEEMKKHHKKNLSILQSLIIQNYTLYNDFLKSSEISYPRFVINYHKTTKI